MEMFETIKKQMELDDIDILNYSPLTLAYIGDSVYEVVVRTVIVDEANRSVDKIHKAASGLVRASAQATIAKAMLDDWTKEEQSVYKRGRNAKVTTKAKNATMGEYKAATGFEALIGYLYLTNQTERMLSIIKKGLEILDEIQ